MSSSQQSKTDMGKKVVFDSKKADQIFDLIAELVQKCQLKNGS
jgi:hypothetical protein